MKKKANIEILYNTEVNKFNLKDGILDSIEIKNNKTKYICLC